MNNNHRLRRQGLALIGVCGLLLGGMGCREERRPLPVSTSEAWSSFISTSSSVVVDRETAVDTRAFFLESPGILERGFERVQRCSAPRTPDAILFMGHYPPASPPFLKTVSAWEACSKRRVKHVVVVSPDHYQRLETGFATTYQSYRVQDRLIPPNEALVQRLQARGAASSTLFAREHGVGVPLALVDVYWPQLETVTAIVASRKIDEQDARALAKELRAFANEPDTLVVVSVDFSHGLPRKEAQAMDRETRQALLAARRSFFWYAQDTHTDFGRGVWILLQLLSEGGQPFIDQSFDSVDLGGETTNVTTFFSGWLTKD